MKKDESIAALLDLSPHILGAMDRAGTILYVNRAAESLWNPDAGDPAGQKLSDQLHPEDAAVLLHALADPAATITLLVRARDRRGPWRPMELTARPGSEENGNVWHFRLRETSTTKADDVVRMERDLLVELAHCATPERALTAVLKAARKLEGVDGGGVYRYHAPRQQLQLVADEGLPEAFLREVAIYGPGHPQLKLVQRGHPLYLGTAPGEPFADQFRRWNIHQVAVLPIVNEGRLRGVLNLGTFQPRDFGPEVRVAMEQLARHAGHLIDHIEITQALRESEERYRELVEVAPEGVVVHENGQYVYANQAAADLCGVARPADMLGRSPLEFLAPEGWQEVRERVGWLLAEGGRILRAESCLLWPDGTRHRCALTGTRITYQGKPAIQTLIHGAMPPPAMPTDPPAPDDQPLRAVVEKAAEGVLIFLPDGTVTFANETARRQLSFLAKGRTPSPWSAHVHQVCMERRPLAFSEQIALRETPCEIESSWVPILDDQQRVRSISCVYRDVTERTRLAWERKQLAHRLLEVQEKERKNISDFLHDHMGPILLMAKMDLEELARAVARKHQPAVARAQQRMDEALRGIRHKALEVRPPLLDDLEAKDALEFLVEELARKHQLDIQLAPLPRLPDLPAAIKICLYRVLQEALLTLAGRSGTGRIEVAVERRPGRLFMRIADSGAGFDVSAVSKEKQLGLVGMREIVESLGGALALLTEPDGATRVEVLIPMDEGPEEAST